MAKPLKLNKSEPIVEKNQTHTVYRDTYTVNSNDSDTWESRTVRHTFYIDKKERKDLRALAKKLKISQSELLRHGIKLVAKHGLES